MEHINSYKSIIRRIFNLKILLILKNVQMYIKLSESSCALKWIIRYYCYKYFRVNFKLSKINKINTLTLRG